MKETICTGKIASVARFRVVIDQEHPEPGPDGEQLYESFIFDRWAFWDNVEQGQTVQVIVERSSNSTIVRFEQIG
jgi:hypothetical protein